MEWLEQYRLLSDRERTEFKRVMNKLVATTFLVKREPSRRDFYFVERYEGLFTGYLRAMGWDLVLDKALGVAQAVNQEGGTRLTLGAWESILLLVVRLIYEQRRKEIRIGEDVMVRIQEIHDKALALKLRERGVVEKKHLKEAFTIFRRFSLVEVLDGDVTHPDTRFLIYPSILFAVNATAMAEIHSGMRSLTSDRLSEETDTTAEEALDENPDGYQTG